MSLTEGKPSTPVAAAEASADDEETKEVSFSSESPPSAAKEAASVEALTPSSDAATTTLKGQKSSSDKTPSTSSRKRNPPAKDSAAAMNKTYEDLVREAIKALKDYRTGSSMPAITKWVVATYPELATNQQLNKKLYQAVKSGVKKKHFTKIKSSYKISAQYREKERAKKRRKSAAAKKADAKRKESGHKSVLEELEKLKAEGPDNLTPEETAKRAADIQRKEEAARRRMEADAKAKAIQDRVRRRRFPMEDTKLHAEDKELGVKPPASVTSRPTLPYFWQGHGIRQKSTVSRKTSQSVLQSSRVEGLDYGSPGLVPDMLAVYHFFRGDVHFSLGEADADIVPEFTLKNMIFAVESILNGTARKHRCVPPLIVHLFVTSLQVLLGGFVQGEGDAAADDYNDVQRRKLRQELKTYLYPALSPSSWADVCYLYMKAMQLFYCSDSTRDPAVLQPLPIDIDYLMGRKSEPDVVATPLPVSKGQPVQTISVLREEPTGEHALPQGYLGYLGDPFGTLQKAYDKLARQDPWNLSAEELMALLRALTDDILSTYPGIAQDLQARDEELHVLSKAKRAADAKFRKVRLAFEGPKQPARKPSQSKDGKKGADDKEADSKTNGKKQATKGEENEDDGDDENDKQEEPFKPTATKRQFEKAQKEQQKANDAYEKGIKKLISRTEPIGYDRDWNRVYCFRSDPEALYVENVRPPSSANSDDRIPGEFQFQRFSWHLIEKTSLFDRFTPSLDLRGKRERELHETLVGETGSQSLRRFLQDDVKEQADARAKIREKEALLDRLKIAQIKCDEEKGRRSGRLAGQAELELIQIQSEIDSLEREAAGKQSEAAPPDYDDLTGLSTLKKFEAAGRMETRRSREAKVHKVRNFPLLYCSKLISTGNIDGTGPVGILVSSLLEIEEVCQSLAPWERGDVARSAWILRLEEAVHAWNAISEVPMSPTTSRRTMSATPDGTPSSVQSTKRGSDASAGSSSKRRKSENGVVYSPGSTSIHTHTIQTILTLLKQPLLELEDRVADLANVAVAARDEEIADENMSVDENEDDEDEKDRLEKAWKKLVHRIRQTRAKRSSKIRELLVAAVGAARKAHQSDVVADLRAALLLYHPRAASECKIAAVKVLETRGDYEEDDDDDEEEEEEEGIETEDAEEEVEPFLSGEALALGGSLGGSTDSSRDEWVQSVKNAKTISRLAALASGFVSHAKEKLETLQVEGDALTAALKEWKKEADRKKASKPRKGAVGPSEVWANVRYTDEICLVQSEDYEFPTWPAKKCEAKDPEMASSLSSVNRSLVALIGERGSIRVARNENLLPFTGTAPEEEDLSQYSKEVCSQRDEHVVTARRILRGLQKAQQRKK